MHSETGACIAALEYGQHQVTVWLSVDLKEDKKNNVAKQYQKARLRTLNESFDALLTIEDDMVIPSDAIVKLADVPYADIVYGVYLFKMEAPPPLLNINRFEHLNKRGKSLSYFPTEMEQAWEQKIIRCSGMGQGCMFVKRKVLEKIEFTSPPHPDYYPDGPFANDCQRYGFSQYAHFGVECGHIQADGSVLWPHLHDPGIVQGIMRGSNYRNVGVGNA